MQPTKKSPAVQKPTEPKDTKDLTPLEDPKHPYKLNLEDPKSSCYKPHREGGKQEPETTREQFALNSLNQVVLPGLTFRWKLFKAEDGSRMARFNIISRTDALYKARQIVEAINRVLDSKMVDTKEVKVDAKETKAAPRKLYVANYCKLNTKEPHGNTTSYAVIIPHINCINQGKIKKICKYIQNSWLHDCAQSEFYICQLPTTTDINKPISKSKIEMIKTSFKDIINSKENERKQRGLKFAKKQKNKPKDKAAPGGWTAKMFLPQHGNITLQQPQIPGIYKGYAKNLFIACIQIFPHLNYSLALQNPWLSTSINDNVKMLMKQTGILEKHRYFITEGVFFLQAKNMVNNWITFLEEFFSAFDDYCLPTKIVFAEGKYFASLLLSPIYLKFIPLLPSFNQLLFEGKIILQQDSLLLLLPSVEIIIEQVNKFITWFDDEIERLNKENPCNYQFSAEIRSALNERISEHINKAFRDLISRLEAVILVLFTELNNYFSNRDENSALKDLGQMHVSSHTYILAAINSEQGPNLDKDRKKPLWDSRQPTEIAPMLDDFSQSHSHSQKITGSSLSMMSMINRGLLTANNLIYFSSLFSTQNNSEEFNSPTTIFVQPYTCPDLSWRTP